ncbi:DUF4124 domain-containing protein [Aurantivibrio plasticivorans]
MNKTLRRALPLLCCLGFLSFSAQAAQTFYKWVDQDGVTHYSARKPHGQEAEEVTIRGGRQTSSPQSQPKEPTPSSQPSSADAAATASTANKDQERCSIAKENLTTLQSFSRVREKDSDGEYRVLSEEEKQKRIENLKAIIKESC